MKTIRMILFALFFITPIHADVIGNPLIWVLYDPLLLTALVLGLCLLSILLRRILIKKRKRK